MPEPPFRVSTPVPPVIEKLPESASVKSIVILVFAPERLAAPELVFLVPFVATKAVMSAAFAVALPVTTKISLVVKSTTVSVPESTLKVSAPALPVMVSFPAPPVKLSSPALP